MALWLYAIFASTSTCMLASFVPRRMHMTLPTAVPGVTSVVMLLITYNLGRARCGRQCRCLGGRRAAGRWHGAARGGSQLCLLICRRAGRHLAHERRCSPGFDYQSDVGVRGPRLGFCPRPPHHSPALVRAVRLPLNRSP